MDVDIEFATTALKSDGKLSYFLLHDICSRASSAKSKSNLDPSAAQGVSNLIFSDVLKARKFDGTQA
eukprot:gene3747-6276_t